MEYTTKISWQVAEIICYATLFIGFTFIAARILISYHRHRKRQRELDENIKRMSYSKRD